MDFWGWIAIGFFLAVIGLALWALWRQSHTVPAGTKLTDDSERRRGLRWIGWWTAGGRG
jgi:quinol-cytochrome oxidoreductase complex cytochrome b subunit